MLHSNIVGSSTAKRRLECPGSIDLEAAAPPQEDSRYAAEGTALHEAMEWLLDHQKMPAEAVGRIFYGHEITLEYFALLEDCVNAFAMIAGRRDYEVERTLPFPGIDGAFGTGDVLIFSDDQSRFDVMDWKFGAGVPVLTPGNVQMKFLLSAARAAYPEDITPDTRMFATIVQPRLDYTETAEFTHAELDTFETDLKHAVEVRRYAENNLKTGDHCRFCRAIPICPARLAEARRAFAWGKIARENLPEALAMVDVVEEWTAAVRQAAHDALEAGAEVQGWKLVAKRGSRDWIEQDDAKLEKLLLRKLGLTKAQRMVSKIISPAQAEKLVGKAKVKPLVQEVPGNGSTLAREDDRRPATNRPARDMKVFARAMQTKTSTGDANE